ncbi:glycoside hydrolase family 95-like protein, partial [Dysgonomonas capnocytophagoides]
SHSGYIELLPAMTQSCKNGEVKGLRVRGGASVDFFFVVSILTNS